MFVSASIVPGLAQVYALQCFRRVRVFHTLKLNGVEIHEAAIAGLLLLYTRANINS